ncbi:hypothetical protein PAHAL_2G246200, partial [Panicum hallii]
RSQVALPDPGTATPSQGQRWLASSGPPPPAVSQSPSLLWERAPKQPPLSSPLSPPPPSLPPPLLYHVAGPSQSFSSFRVCHSSLLDQ